MKVLFISDKQVIDDAALGLLKAKHEILSSTTSTAAISMITEHSPDVAILNHTLTDSDGFELVKKIRENPSNKGTILIMVDVDAGKEIMNKAISAGCFYYLRLPLDIIDLSIKLDFLEKLLADTSNRTDYIHTSILPGIIATQRLQSSMVMNFLSFENSFYDFFILNMPREILNGLFCLSFKDSNKILFMVYDSISTGIPGAMFTMLAYMAVHRIVNSEKITNPQLIATELNKELMEIFTRSLNLNTTVTGMDAIICEFDVPSNTLKFVGAHRPLIVVRKGKEPLKVNGSNLDEFAQFIDYHLYHFNGSSHSISFEKQNIIFEEQQIQLIKGDRLFLFTDGYIDQIGGEKGQRLSRKQLHTLLLEHQYLSMHDLKHKLFTNFKEWTAKHEQADDVMIIGIEI
jgi:CheY-like chemotaxis protein